MHKIRDYEMVAMEQPLIKIKFTKKSKKRNDKRLFNSKEKNRREQRRARENN